MDQAKAAAAKVYQATGKPQAVVATSGTEEPAPVEATHVTVQNTTKTYDGNADTPANYAVELSDNLTAPQGWYVTDTINQYLVDPTDLNLSQVSQNVGSYDITLSETGLQKLNAVAANQQKNLTVSAADVTAGKLTITKAPVPTGTVAILAAAKPYDNDATTDPTSYNVQLDAGIVAPTDWTRNADGTYKVNVASGDLDAAITSQTAGDYQVTLSNAGLQKLNALNANYDITADKVTSGGFQIQDNTKLNIGVAGIAPNATLPTTLTVGVSRTETVPTDWTVNYNNIAQDSEIYNVPMSYFDTSAVDNTKIGTYTVNLTTTALNNLNTANPDKQLAVTNIQPGKIFVTNDTNLPARDLSNFGGGLAGLNEIDNKQGDNNANPVFSNGAGFDMSLSFFGTTSEKQNNFTNIVIVPAGLTIATATSNSVDGKTTTLYTKADDPVTAIVNQVQPQLEQAVTNGLVYTDFKVTQLNNYKGRQAFAVQFGSVDYTHYQGAYNISVMIDPDVTNVTNGHWGNQPDANDNAILYATDTPTFTQGSYKLNYGGDYTNNDQVATTLGLTNAVTLKDSYANTATNPYAHLWGGKFTIVHIPVKDTYNLTDVNGNQVANPVTIQGQVGDGYNALSVVPTTIKDGNGVTQYVLDPSSLVTDQTFKATSQKLDGTEKVAEGQTYTVKYKHVIDTAIAANQVQVQNQAQTWNNTTPSSYTVSVPAGYAVPETWAKNPDGTYTITTASRDIDSTAVGTAVGQYNVTLSKQGIAKLAMLNPDYLFDNKIANFGTVTITPLNIPVNVEDTAGNQLAPQQNVQLGEAKTESGVNVAVDGYPTDQLAQITFNYAMTGNKGVKKSNLYHR
ncbi:MBG domain-containing protein [Secundilactobacillus silagei]|uniref:MBG domain-containing protein n=1 Tax=Secundilactobacillus silagei TaxID=1293415 RepID=UPI002093892B|nr:MBG domain-containing protein [Secundilactobacillus silagei]